MQSISQWQPWQVVGRRMAIGCVALEITQRCNLDCTYCYLSESSEALKDIPLQEVLRRVDLIYAHYGDGTDVQVTGGDPTLRNRAELREIVAYIRKRNMRPSLFTNGILATHELLADLAAAGLEDVAFHVDLSQGRKGYATEEELNRLRLEYIERVRGLPLSVFFNTTVYGENFSQVPQLIRFFKQHCDVVRLAAFQIGADTGRGTARDVAPISPASLQAQIETGAGCVLEFGAMSVGHSACNRYALALVVGEQVIDALADKPLIHELLLKTPHLRFDRRDKRASVLALGKFLLQQPRLLAAVAARVARAAWRARGALARARGRVNKLSFHIHHFQDAAALDRARCHGCAFMVMTPEGPLSMCVHNAKRDQYLLVSAQVGEVNRIQFWNPITGKLQRDKPEQLSTSLTRKTARGKAKERMAASRLHDDVGSTEEVS
jgi:hypothetical protein